MSAIGFKNTGSATLFRLSIAFFAISVGFCVIWIGYMAEDLLLHEGQIHPLIQTLGIGIQTIGYFFIAFSHSIKAFLPRNRQFRAILPVPLFFSSVYIEQIFRSVSFILLAYGAIETIMSYLENRQRGTMIVASGLAMLALGEFLSWYSFVFPESIYPASNIIKIGGLVALFIPVSKVTLAKMRLDDAINDAVKDTINDTVDAGSGSEQDK